MNNVPHQALSSTVESFPITFLCCTVLLANKRMFILLTFVIYIIENYPTLKHTHTKYKYNSKYLIYFCFLFQSVINISLRIVTREEWNAEEPDEVLLDLQLPIERVIIAHTDTAQCINTVKDRAFGAYIPNL